MWLSLVFFLGFLFGALVLAGLEALGGYVLLLRLKRKVSLQASKLSESRDCQRDLDPRQSLKYAHDKKGVVWVLEPDKIPKNWSLEKEQKKRRDFYEVAPVRRSAKIRDRFLILVDSEGTHTAVPLVGCLVETISATNMPSRRWAKRYPIKVESKSSLIYKGSKTVYIYLETSWEKESWCKALRLAACDDKQKLHWFTKVTEEFHSYLTSVNTGYPSFMKPSSGCNGEMIERVTKLDGSTSKVRSFWRKLSRKASKNNSEHKANPSLVRARSRPSQDSLLTSNGLKTVPSVKVPTISDEDNTAPASSFSRSQSHASSDGEYDDRYNVDDGTLCWNLLISRLFYDVKGNLATKSSVQARIQRTLSNMRIPTYIGEVICTSLHLGNLPPYINGIRVHPVDMNDVWMWDVDIEYCGGLVLDIETRLEVRDLDLQKSINTNVESNSGEDISSDLLEGFQNYGKQFNLPEGIAVTQEHKEEGNPRLDASKSISSSQTSSTSMSKWKAIVNSIAKQVSQVPLSLSVRVSSLRGTLRLHIKPPPSDQLWFGFTSMPDIEFELESSVGEHKITSGHIALFLINRFKNVIRETLVLPNCESMCIPWMLAEKNDWVPRKVAPFMWLNREVTGDHAPAGEAISSLPPKSKSKSEDKKGTSSNSSPDSSHEANRNTGEDQHLKPDSSDSPTSSEKSPTETNKSLGELTTPLLVHQALQETEEQNGNHISENSSTSRSLINVDWSIEGVDETKKSGRRTRMFDLGKKMSEKLEEKRRHIEEKGRSFVEKMRDKAEK